MSGKSRIVSLALPGHLPVFARIVSLRLTSLFAKIGGRRPPSSRSELTQTLRTSTFGCPAGF